jgi:integrase
MATITVSLRKDQPDKEGRCRIILIYRNGDKPAIKHSVGEKVKLTQFDFDKEKVVNHDKSDELNYLIFQQRQFLNNVVFDIKRDGDIPTPRLVKSLLKSYKEQQEGIQRIVGRGEDEHGDNVWVVGDEDSPKIHEKVTLSQAWDKLILLKKNIVTSATLSIYRTTFDHLSMYCSLKGRELDWNLFEPDFYNYWNNYFIDECENQYGDTGLSNNTIGKYFKTLKQFLNWAVEKGYHNDLSYKRYKIVREEVNINPLSENDLAKIVWFCDNKENNLRLRKVGSLFVFLATTGMRFSDGQNLKWSNLYYTGEGDINSQVIRITTQKTSQGLIIPLSGYSIKELVRNATEFGGSDKMISEILKPNNDLFDFGDIREYFKNEVDLDKSLLPQISSVKFNKYIKEVAKACGFFEPITVVRKIGSKVDSRSFRRWEKISSHDCRRTFITLSLKKGMRPEMVMSITGHKSYKTMLRYNRLTEMDKVDEFQEIWGYSKQTYSEDLGFMGFGIGNSRVRKEKKKKGSL